MNTQVSALDAAYALSALLEYPSKIGAGIDSENKNPNGQVESLIDIQSNNFYLALNALSDKHLLDTMAEGIELAKQM